MTWPIRFTAVPVSLSVVCAAVSSGAFSEDGVGGGLGGVPVVGGSRRGASLQRERRGDPGACDHQLSLLRYHWPSS
jgi:hypothetical protein